MAVELPRIGSRRGLTSHNTAVHVCRSDLRSVACASCASRAFGSRHHDYAYGPRSARRPPWLTKVPLSRREIAAKGAPSDEPYHQSSREVSSPTSPSHESEQAMPLANKCRIGSEWFFLFCSKQVWKKNAKGRHSIFRISHTIPLRSGKRKRHGTCAAGTRSTQERKIKDTKHQHGQKMYALRKLRCAQRLPSVSLSSGPPALNT